jgi:hypothetical protein
MLHRDFVPAESRQWMEDVSYCAAGLRCLQVKRQQARDLDDLIDGLSGYTKVRTLDGAHGARYRYHGKAVVSFTWIPRWAWSAWEMSQYLQLDCSFRASRPFAYSVPQGVVCNQAIPLALVLNLSESKETYAWFLEDLHASQGVGIPESPEKPVLSDQGWALQAFCRRYHFEQYFCHRHLIERFGASSPLGILFTRVLRETSQRSYDQHRAQYLADAAALLELKLVKPADHAHFCSLLSKHLSTASGSDNAWESRPAAITLNGSTESLTNTCPLVVAFRSDWPLFAIK